jgi:hypothetical protein
MIKGDLIDHVFKMEDKGSCLVTLDRSEYGNNVKNNLEASDIYEKIKVKANDQVLF